MKEKMKEKIKAPRKNEEKKRLKEDFFFEKCLRTLEPPDELAQKVSKNSLSDELFLHFLRKFRI